MKDALLATVTEEVAAVHAFEVLLTDALIAVQPMGVLPGIHPEQGPH